MRSRNIKVGFFRNEELVEVSPLGRLLFIGLWCLADRKGLLEDRPKKIKLEVIPYDVVDCNKLLQELHTHGLISRYSVNGKNYIAIPKFLRHQRPHQNEKSSELPSPKLATKVTSACDQGLPHSALNPDVLNPDVLNPEKRIKGGKPPPECPHKKIIGLYLKILPEMPEVKIWNDDQESWLRTRWKEDKSRQSLDWWKKFFSWIRESDFLMGRTKEEFQCDLEWLIRKRNFAKIANGRYHRKKNGAQPGIDEWLKIKTTQWEAKHEGKK